MYAGSVSEPGSILLNIKSAPDRLLDRCSRCIGSQALVPCTTSPFKLRLRSRAQSPVPEKLCIMRELQFHQRKRAVAVAIAVQLWQYCRGCAVRSHICYLRAVSPFWSVFAHVTFGLPQVLRNFSMIVIC